MSKRSHNHKHLIQIEQQLREKLPGIQLSYRSGRRHKILCAVLNGREKHLSVSSSPTQPEHCVAHTVRTITKFFKEDTHEHNTAQQF